MLKNKKIDLAFSSCPNDTFVFHGMLNKLVDTRGLSFKPYIDDVESLNQQAKRGRYHISKLSFFAWLKLQDKYELLDSGAALGFGCGPLLVAGSKDISIKDALIAVPGADTTANLLFRLKFPEAKNIRIVRFDEILPGIEAGRFDGGVIIHEGRFVFQEYGCFQIIDLGEWWETESSSPIPLGCIAIRNDEDTRDLKKDIESIIRASARYALENPEASRDYIKLHAQELDDMVIDQHIRLYVNEFTLSMGKEGKRALETLEEMARCKGIL